MGELKSTNNFNKEVKDVSLDLP